MPSEKNNHLRENTKPVPSVVEPRTTPLGHSIEPTLIQQAFDALRSESDQLAQYALAVTDDLEMTRQRLQSQEETQDRRQRQLDERAESLERARAELSESRREWENQQKESRSAKATKKAKSPDDTSVVQALEEELEQIRRRAADLEDQIASLEEEADHRQADFDKEVAKLKEEVMVQQRIAAAMNQMRESSVAAALPPEQAPRPGSAESAVGNVMQQFTRLQEEAAQRRQS